MYVYSSDACLLRYFMSRNISTNICLPHVRRLTMPPRPTKTSWSHEFETLRREDLFRNPPKDHSAYPALLAAVKPHIGSFNAVLEKDGLIAQAVRDIGTKIFLDGDERGPPATRNKLSISIKEVFVEKSQLPASNKFSTKNREILPAECRERHVTYRGKLSARLEYRINNGDPKEFIRELGQLPLMLKVSRANILCLASAYGHS
jgi:DNA-directed RNA polymerase I subunit RPA2